MQTFTKFQHHYETFSCFFISTSVHFLFYATLALMAGIAWAYNGYHLAIQSTIIIATIILLVALYTFKKNFTLPIILLFSFYLGGFLYWQKLHSQENFYSSIANQKISLQATVENIEAIDNPRFNYRVSLCLSAINTQKDFQSCNQNSIVLYVKHVDDLHTGDLIQINNVAFKKAGNESFNTYLLKEGYVASLFLEKFEYTVISRPAWSINKSISDLKEHALSEVAYKMDRQAFKLYSSLFLGNRTVVKKEMENTKESFKAWGISHYLARSGLHLVIFVLIWHFILGLIPISYFAKQCFIIFLILIYATLSWSSVSFERALLMFLLYKFCLAHKAPIYYIHLITLATLIILLFNPLELFFLDFQLSFGITFALAWFNSVQAEKRRLA